MQNTQKIYGTLYKKIYGTLYKMYEVYDVNLIIFTCYNSNNNKLRSLFQNYQL